MSVLDGLTENRTDVSGILRDEERLIVCPADKRPADYLMLDKRDRITLIVQIYEGYNPQYPGSYSRTVSRNIIDYLYEIPSLCDLSTAVMFQVPLDKVEPLNIHCETLIKNVPGNYYENNWMLVVSFYTCVRSYYSLMKLIRGLHYTCPRRFSLVTYPLLRWENEQQELYYIHIDEDFMIKIGLSKWFAVPTMISSNILTSMCQLSKQVGLLEKYSSDEDADKVRITDEIERWSIRLKNRDKLKMNAV